MEKKTIFGQKCVVFDKKTKKLLILQRSGYKGDEGLWDLIGGSVDFCEDSKSAIKREAREETKIILLNPIPIDVHSRIVNNGKVFFIFALYFCYKYLIAKSDIKISSEHSNYKWISITDIDKYKFRETVEYVKEVIIEYIANLE